MDVTVSREDESRWLLTDLLGRSMGRVVEGPDRQFTILPEGKAVETMQHLNKGPYGSLDEALAEIERHTRGTCRRAGGATHQSD